MTLTAEEIIAVLPAASGGVQGAEEIEFREELPKTLVGKVLRRVFERRKSAAGAG